MARMKNINFENNEITFTMSASKEEYLMVATSRDNLVVLPTDDKFFERELTVGKSGTSNRIMVPNGFLKQHKISKLMKLAPARSIEINNKKYLFIKVEGSSSIPESGTKKSKK